MSECLYRVLDALLFITPCYVANGVPVLVSRLVRRRHPIDMGRVFRDGRRVFGEGKTWEGLVCAVACGTLSGAVLDGHSLYGAFVLSLGAMLGDLAGSFVKRRLGIERGGRAPLLDELGFVVASLALYQVLIGGLDPVTVTVVLLLTPPLHRVSNIMAYRLGLKDKPW